jgi:hypothetical protein
MSTKTTFKRVALVTVAALGFGLLSSVTPASAAPSTAMAVAVGPNGATSLTVVTASGVPKALVRIDITAADTATAGTPKGLQLGETITATVTGVPTAVTAKTLLANGGKMGETATVQGTAGYSDFIMLESKGQTSGVPGLTADTTSKWTDWSKLSDSVTPTAGIPDTTTNSAEQAADGFITQENTPFTNMDGNRNLANNTTVASYYVTIAPRKGATVLDQGAYTFQFQLVDGNGVVRGTKTIKIDFVSAASKSDAVLAWTVAGTFRTAAALATTDATGYAAYAKLALTNRDGGLVRLNDGTAPVPTVSIQDLALTPVADTLTVGSVSDTGTAALDFGSESTTTGVGGGSLKSQDGVYGVRYAALPATATSADGTTQAYQFWAAYGNATFATKAFTLYSGTASASYLDTDVLVTADGMSAADQLLIADDANATYNWTVPTTTKTATVKFYIQNSSDTGVAAASMTVTPTWTLAATGVGTPATSTTGTVYTTDSNGLVTISVTNSAPVDTAKLTLVVTGAAAFGTDKYTASITWAKPVATTIAVADPLSGVHVKTSSTNVTTVIVKDQFGNPVSGQSVNVSIPTTLNANSSTTVTIPAITTGASGTATYSLVGGATNDTYDTITFQCAPTACGTAATMTYNYMTTIPAAATLSAYHNLSWGSDATTLTPATGIYATGTTKLILEDARNISKAQATTSDANTTNDEVNLRFYALAAGSVAAEGAVVTVTAGDGGHILDASGLPVSSRNFLVGEDGYTANIQVLATKTGDITFTATSGTVTATATLKVAGRLVGDNSDKAGRFVTITGATTGTANGTGVPVTVTVTDRYGNVVSGAALNVVASGVGSFMGGAITQSFTTDASGTYTFLANTSVSEGGVAKFTATTGTPGSFSSAAGYVGATEVDSTLAAGNSSASASITFAAGSSASDVAQTATDAAAEATDAANAATDAANAAAEAADAATAAAQDAADAVAALSAQVASLISGLKSQLTALTNLVIKIQKKVKA